MTLVCRPTLIVRFMHRGETSSTQLLYRMARLVNAVVLLPTALCRGTAKTLFSLQRVKELLTSSFAPLQKWK
jgi:hypothetical protein